LYIDRKDVLWNYASTFLKVAAQTLLFPFILRFLPQETIGVWTIFSTIIALVSLLDFGFNPSFTRNVTYILSGVKSLKSTSFQITEKNAEIDYGLLKGLIGVMRSFYSCMAIILLAVLLSAGTYYIHIILRTYSGNKNEVFIAWVVLCAINAYSFYTLYYDALLLGMGLVKRSKQIAIVGQLFYLITAIVLILGGFGLIAIVSAQAVSVIVRRILSYRWVYTPELKNRLRNAGVCAKKDIFKAVYPNAVKVGLSAIGGFMISRSAVIIGSLYLPLDIIASYGITIQIIGVIGSIAGVYFNTYQPKIAQFRVRNDMSAIKKIYKKNCLIVLIVYIFFGLFLLIFGQWGLTIIGSKTSLVPRLCIVAALLVSLLETNTSISGYMLLTKNEVPFFKSGLISGLCIIVLFFISYRIFDFGIWGLIVIPCIVQCCYSHWKWPLEVYKELRG
jgi:O-antigen/teichoic acid export membrane protein